MGQIPSLYVFSAGTVILSAYVNSNFSNIRTTYNNHDAAADSTVHGNAFVPLGGIIPHYDFNGTVTLPTNFAYCDGSTVTNASSPFYGMTLPDLSNRYIVGYGTEAGGDIDTAAWNPAFVGNANHQVSLNHVHDSGTLKFRTGNYNNDVGYHACINYAGSDEAVFVRYPLSYSSGASSKYIAIPGLSNNIDFYTGAGIGATDIAGSSTQSIQPRSIRARYIMRIV